jgi:hypothetical protein
MRPNDGNSCEANRSSVSREIPRMLWNCKIHYRILKRPVPILSQINLIYASPSYCLKMIIGLSNIVSITF